MSSNLTKQEHPIFPVKLQATVLEVVLRLTSLTEINSAVAKDFTDGAIKAAKAVRKEVETVRMSFSKPLDEKKAALMNLERDVTRELDYEIARLTGLVNSFLKAQHQQVLAEKARLDAEEEARLKRLTSTKSIAKVTEEFEEKRAEIATTQTGVRMQKHWQVTDINLVPRELLMADANLVGLAIKRGQTDIPGLKIWEEPIRSGR